MFLYLCLQELAKQIDDYTATYEPDDQLEWSLVLGEIRAFIEVYILCSFSVYCSQKIISCPY